MKNVLNHPKSTTYPRISPMKQPSKKDKVVMRNKNKSNILVVSFKNWNSKKFFTDPKLINFNKRETRSNYQLANIYTSKVEKKHKNKRKNSRKVLQMKSQKSFMKIRKLQPFIESSCCLMTMKMVSFPSLISI